MSIRRLPENLVREIAAGEVVTRPADIIKELLENALDAGATRIEIELRNGGKNFLRVSDDGVGIAATELPLAVERFATSKLQDSNDSEFLSRIHSLGFRGEALWSIAFASQLSVVSRPAAQLGGAKIKVLFGEVAQPEQIVCAAGTSIEVRELFAHLPARRATLESDAVETRRVHDVVARYVLHHPHVSWKFVSDDDVRLQHAPGAWRDATANLYGPMTANRMMDVAQADGDYNLQGVVSRPELMRPRKDRLHLAVNGRPIETEERMANAISRAYGELLPRNQWPTVVLNLNLPSQDLNQNVHPGKLRVAFLDAPRAEELLVNAIRAALAVHPLARAAPEPRIVVGPLRVESGFPELHYIGAYRDAYLLAEGDGDLWMLDQHAAHERIIYEELETAFGTGANLELESPELVTLSATEAMALESKQTELQAFGLNLENFGAGLYRVRSIPAAMAGLHIANLVPEIISEALSANDAQRAVLARLACHPAIKAGHKLSHADASALIAALRACNTPWACPHGRPTALRLTERDLAHQFGRRSVRDVPRVGDEKKRAISDK